MEAKEIPAINNADKKLIENIRQHGSGSSALVRDRLNALEREWDIETIMQLNTGLAAFGSVFLGMFNRKWFIIPGIIAGLLTHHVIKGASPVAEILRKLGYRSRKEIEHEKYALKSLRGDFDDVYDTADAYHAVKA